MTTILLCGSCKDPAVCVAAFRANLDLSELEITLDSTLSTLPESVHLHVRRRGERSGVLEYTMDVRRRTAWLSWHENRHRPWIDDAVRSLQGSGTFCP